MILSVDPSSSCIGWAVFGDAGKLVEFGRVVPKASVVGKPLVRIPAMAAELVALLDCGIDVRRVITEAVLEVNEGKVHRARKGGGGAGMSIYGAAWGYVWAKLDARLPVHAVPANEWTRGQQKSQRQARVIALHRSYVPAADPGMDVSDAIALGDWWIVERDVRRRTGRP